MKFNKLIPELSVTNLNQSKEFYIERLGFIKEYERTEDRFIFLSLDGSQIMLEEINDHWKTGDLERPFRRGRNFQIEKSDPKSLALSLRDDELALYKDIARTNYRTPNGPKEQVEFIVQDPDGYLLRFCN